jgi:cytochrome c-type biogenesis protein CcmH/NrfG
MDSPKPEPKEPKDPALEQARASLGKQDWMGAQKILREAVARNPQDADAHNLYAYSIRKGANPAMDLVYRHYNEALRLNPMHRAAHEYLGEAYLMSGNVAKAKELLAQLDKLCNHACEEYSKLQQEVAQYEQQHAKK